MQNRAHGRPRTVALTCRISQSLADALAQHRAATGENMEHVVRAALADYLQVEHGTLFQVSTAGALVAGLSAGEVTVGTLKEHGDFGLGTFERLDGEMVAVDGRFLRVTGDGRAYDVDEGALTPYAMVTRFVPETHVPLGTCADLAELHAKLDRARRSDNHFHAIRVDGVFSRLCTRSLYPSAHAVPLADAVLEQRTFEMTDVEATLVGFWSPPYVTALAVPGYHLHAITRDRTAGGHLLDCRGRELWADVQHEADFRLSLPESESFLRADLTRDPTAALAQAESARR